ESLAESGLPAEALQMVATEDRAAISHLLRLSSYIDLAIPRGGPGVIQRVVGEARMPVLKHYLVNCHGYVDPSANLKMAEMILINAKCQRPGVCNAAESLLVHEKIAGTFLPNVASLLRQKGVELRGCETTRRLVPEARAATEEDFAAEFLELILSIKVVSS